MNTQHTPEPWESGGIPVSGAEEIKHELLDDLQRAIGSHTGTFGDHVMVIYRQDGARIAYLAGPTAEENCSRIVACVNACAGVDTETLVAMANGEMNGSEIWELAKVKKQRDELLDTLRCFANGEITKIDGVILLSAAAIAKAGGSRNENSCITALKKTR